MREIKIDTGWGRLPRLIIKKMAGLKLNQYENKVAWAIVYFTIGYSYFDDWIAQSQLVEMTGIDQRHIDRTLKSLVKKGIIYKNHYYYRLVIEFDIIKNISGKKVNKKYTWSGKDYTCGGVKFTPVQADSKDSSKDINPKKAVLEVKMTRKEIMKLEGREYLRAEFVARGEWDIKFIDELVNKYEYMQVYDCLLALQESYGVRDSKGWFLNKLDKWIGER